MLFPGFGTAFPLVKYEQHKRYHALFGMIVRHLYSPQAMLVVYQE
jgi:hypothetical protein